MLKSLKKVVILKLIYLPQDSLKHLSGVVMPGGRGENIIVYSMSRDYVCYLVPFMLTNDGTWTRVKVEGHLRKIFIGKLKGVGKSSCCNDNLEVRKIEDLKKINFM